MPEEHHALEEHSLLTLLLIVHSFDHGLHCFQSLEDFCVTFLIHFFRNYKLKLLLNMPIKVFNNELDGTLHPECNLGAHLILN